MDGDIREPQLSWFVKELQNAPNDKALIVAVHHPAYSADNVHGGSRKVGKVLDKSFEEADRKPNIVLSGHVHNYQRYSRETDDGKQIPYIISGAGGCHNLHPLQKHNDRTKIEVPYEMQDSGTILEKYSDDRFGFMRIEISQDKIKGVYYVTAFKNEPDHSGVRQIDTFEVDWHNYKIIKGSSI